jgi:hypothetical protein
VSLPEDVGGNTDVAAISGGSEKKRREVTAGGLPSGQVSAA